MERVVDTTVAADPATPGSTTESLDDEFSPKLPPVPGPEFGPEPPPAPGAGLPHPILCSAETHRTLSGFRAVYSYFPCATGGELFTRRVVRIPSSLMNSDEDIPTKKKQNMCFVAGSVVVVVVLVP